MLRNLLFFASAAMISAGTASAEGKAQGNGRKPILLVLTSHSQLGKTGGPTGFFLSEAAHPWEVFRASGYEVTLASPKGGFAPVDPKSFQLEDESNGVFWKAYGSEVDGTKGVRNTRPLADLEPADFSAVFYAGGHGAMWDFPNDPDVTRLGAAIYGQGGAVGAVCHGPAALLHMKLPDGTPLMNGKRVAGFTNEEEAAAGLTKVVPFLLEDALENAGASHVRGSKFQEQAVRDGRLATGQNPASATLAARLLIEALREPETYLFKDTGAIPNNPKLPLLIYAGAGSNDPEKLEEMLARNGWSPAWRWSVFSYPHYHSTAHEVLGVYRGRAKIRLGHTEGRVFEVKAGDVIVIPAGVGHQNLGASPDFHVVGGYPPGQDADLLRGEPGERPQADENIRKTPLPKTDPVFGEAGPLTRLWK